MTAISHSQHTFAYTVGTLVGVVLSMIAPAHAWLLFGILSSIQMYAVHKATSSVALSSLDASRGPALAREFLEGGRLSSPEEMRRKERFEWPFFNGVPSPPGFLLDVGASPIVFGSTQMLDAAVSKAKLAKHLFLVHWDSKRASIILHSEARDRDIVQGLFEAVRISLPVADAKFEDFETALEEAGWTLEGTAMETSSKQIRVEWD